MIKSLFAFAIVLAFGIALTSNAAAQTKKRDSLTADEDEIIREAQELDVRIRLYTKVIDRRFTVLNGGEILANPNKKQSKEEKKEAKESSLLGDLPTGTRAQLLSDISRNLDEARNKIDDVYQYDAKNPLVAKSLNNLAIACERYLPQLKTILANAKTEDERENVASAIEIAESVVNAKTEAKTVK
ncbi:MAG: hypothetical protein H7Z37_06475 [Pyrinomonadaceae bacterium]|nr:hypothetical protein [Pyrinomonadaceae bacterium]